MDYIPVLDAMHTLLAFLDAESVRASIMVAGLPAGSDVEE